MILGPNLFFRKVMFISFFLIGLHSFFSSLKQYIYIFFLYPACGLCFEKDKTSVWFAHTSKSYQYISYSLENYGTFFTLKMYQIIFYYGVSAMCCCFLLFCIVHGRVNTITGKTQKQLFAHTLSTMNQTQTKRLYLNHRRGLWKFTQLFSSRVLQIYCFTAK